MLGKYNIFDISLIFQLYAYHCRIILNFPILILEEFSDPGDSALYPRKQIIIDGILVDFFLFID